MICQQFCLLSVGGNSLFRSLLESAGPGVWAGTPVPTDSSTGNGRSSPVRLRVSPPRGLIAGSREGKNPFEIFPNSYITFVENE